MSVSISFQDVCLRIVSIHAIKSTHLNFIDYVEAADHHLDLPDAQVEEEEEVVVTEPVSLTNIETMLRNARAFCELSPIE